MFGKDSVEFNIPFEKIYKKGKFKSLSDGLRIFEDVKNVMIEESVTGNLTGNS